MNQINVTKVALDDCISQDSINQTDIKVYSKRVDNLNAQIITLEQKISTLTLIRDEKDIQNEIITKELQSANKENKKLKNRVKVFTFVGTIGGLLGGGAIGYIVGKNLK